MITTKTGAKKLEANDNWAKIVPNAQGQDSAHNDSVEAHDSAIESLCQTISGTTNNCGHTINSGEFFIANGGKYKATASIPVNGAWSGSAQAVSDNDLINALNNRLTTLNNSVPIEGSYGAFVYFDSSGTYSTSIFGNFKGKNISLNSVYCNGAEYTSYCYVTEKTNNSFVINCNNAAVHGQLASVSYSVS